MDTAENPGAECELRHEQPGNGDGDQEEGEDQADDGAVNQADFSEFVSVVSHG